MGGFFRIMNTEGQISSTVIVCLNNLDKKTSMKFYVRFLNMQACSAIDWIAIAKRSCKILKRDREANHERKSILISW